MTRQSSLYRNIEKRLPGTLAEFVAARRATHTWRAIAGEIAIAADMEITGETVRRWFCDAEERTEAGAA